MPPGVPQPHYDPTNPLIVQGDRSILVEVDNPRCAEAPDALAPFAELEKSPEHIHPYRLTPLSLWNAAAPGMSGAEMGVGPGRLRRGQAGAGRRQAAPGLRGPAPAGGAGSAAEGPRVPRRAPRRRKLP